MTDWLVAFGDDRVLRFTDEQDAVTFAHFDSQLVGSSAVVTRREGDGSVMVIDVFSAPGVKGL